MQYALCYDLEELLDGLPYVGYLGKGPSYNPISFGWEEELYSDEDGEWDGWSDSYSYSCQYLINSDGTVYSSTIHSDDYDSDDIAYFEYADYSSYLSSSSPNTKSLETYEEVTTGSSSHRSISRSRMRSRRFTNR